MDENEFHTPFDCMHFVDELLRDENPKEEHFADVPRADLGEIWDELCRRRTLIGNQADAAKAAADQISNELESKDDMTASVFLEKKEEYIRRLEKCLDLLIAEARLRQFHDAANREYFARPILTLQDEVDAVGQEMKAASTSYEKGELEAIMLSQQGRIIQIAREAGVEDVVPLHGIENWQKRN